MGSVTAPWVLAGYESLLIGFSGGVDSSLLTVAARRVLGKERTVAAVGTSPSLPSAQLEQARQIASRFDLNIYEINTDELDDPRYVANTPQRPSICGQHSATLLLLQERTVDQTG